MFHLFKKKPPVAIITPPTENNKPLSIFSTDFVTTLDRKKLIERAYNRTFQRTADDFKGRHQGTATDSNVKSISSFSGQLIPDAQLSWYASQGFIGTQLCAILAQHWLIDKACRMPAEDAVRKGFDITVNDGTDVAVEILDAIKKADVQYKLNANLVEFVQFGRVFGIRIAMFIIESEDPDYYVHPFNIDGVTPGSYKGISQIDPYWITPELDGEAAGDPSSIHFYEPTWWRVNGRRIHRTHLIIMRNGQVADVLKPTYVYGGIPVPQKICERVYAAERTANEAPQLALTKRTTILQTDVEQALTNQQMFEQRIAQWAYFRDNYGIKTIGLNDTANQFDTSLADLDAVIMTQYQIVAAAAGVPAVKLLGTSPKGFNTTGEFEESNYHEELESIQTHALTPLIERHHALLIHSEIAPQFSVSPFTTRTVWKPLDSLTAKEQAEINKLKADTDAVLNSTGGIDGMDVRQRIINDPNSGFDGLSEEPSISVANDPELGDIDEEETDLSQSGLEDGPTVTY